MTSPPPNPDDGTTIAVAMVVVAEWKRPEAGPPND
ncbi:hypothetical protein ACVWXN_000307 [Bradyrhizobium sp. i1.4.4]|jgi:hypothetical protein|nr:hypothetical protein [Bradyrhizobium japonicum]MCP1794525.1 hypothetical protein [Bradyrhizobium japonicum]MCP1811209.1 hypothetical protein [Bradyrhizobium japonicum]MCP1821426.1 hypothetical protein [Bradyrhizobium japonicum]MCP1876461.1 hypothetical protein [Bradyrhizobium japonicum]